MSWSREDFRRLFRVKDYINGSKYVREGRVRNLIIEDTTENCKVTCQVKGVQLYDVSFRLYRDQVRVRCTCPRYEEYHICKHIAAATIAYCDKRDEQNQAVTPHKRSSGNTILHHYLSQFTMTSDQMRYARLVPTLHPNENGYPNWSFQVGIDRLYVIQDIFQFVQNVRSGNTVRYGKELTLCHKLDRFEPLSQSLIRILLDQVS